MNFENLAKIYLMENRAVIMSSVARVIGRKGVKIEA
jgi:hypothetical protein